MSDFEQWYESEFDSGLHYDATVKAWQAAIASMQGAAVGYASEESVKTASNGGDAIFGREVADLRPVALFTYPPSAAAKIAEQDARIKELEQQLEVARKDAERYKKLREVIISQPGGQYAFATFMGWVPDTFKHGFDQSIDAAIRQIGGAE